MSSSPSITNSTALKAQFEDAAGEDGILTEAEAQDYIERNPDSLLSVALQDLDGNFNDDAFRDMSGGDGEITEEDFEKNFEKTVIDTFRWIASNTTTSTDPNFTNKALSWSSRLGDATVDVETIETFNTDGVRGVSYEEAKASSTFDDDFAAADTDGNGTLSDAEMAAYAAIAGVGSANPTALGVYCSEQPQVQAIARFDTDKDGTISEAEVIAQSTSEDVAELDADGDGTYSDKEIQDYIAAHGMNSTDPTALGVFMEQEYAKVVAALEQQLSAECEAADADDDGYITEEELNDYIEANPTSLLALSLAPNGTVSDEVFSILSGGDDYISMDDMSNNWVNAATTALGGNTTV